MSIKNILSVLFFAGVIFACSEAESPTLFERLDNQVSNISFSNDLSEEEGLDVFRYRNFYNGAGVGIGDFNNDGLSDVYFVANQKSNRLYLNEGDFNFKDVTEQAGVAGQTPWSSGVTIADVNGDGWLDIYVSNSGDPNGDDRKNELFINNHDGTFTEQAAEFGLNDGGYTTHSAFFDYDNDGDLDCFVMNNSFRPVSSLPLKNIRDVSDEGGGDRFYENKDGTFVDISEQAGIFSSIIAFGLSATLVDVNRDGWTDIYVSNDFFERDYLYVNHHGEGFKEELEERMDQISLASMGADAEDLNNDGWPEIFVTEMLPEESSRLKQITSFESYKSFELKKERGFYNQFQRNTLQLNKNGKYSEIGRYANVHATDWSWSALMFDMNNDAQKEIFVTNGIYKDVTDQDFLEYFGSEENLSAAKEGSEVHFDKFVERMPSNPIPNYAFALDSALVFQNRSKEWGLDTPSFSNGVTIGDLDNDGDQDLIVNNLNQSPFIYRNNTDEFHHTNHYLKAHLKGDKKNLFAIGASVTAYIGDEQVTRHQYPSRGFQSSVSHELVLGLGAADHIDSLEIRWDHERISRYYDVPVDTQLTFSIADANKEKIHFESVDEIFTEVSFDHKHRENDFNDFDQSELIYHKLSREGPPVAVADLNEDGEDDFFIGGATGSSGSLYLNMGNDTFRKISIPAFENNASQEEVDAIFFDANGDGNKDLYVVSGGNEVGSDRRKFADRLYINKGIQNGHPVFEVSDGLPNLFASGSVVRSTDFDQDGDMDLFVGSRSIPGEYGKFPDSYLLENDGKGNFSDVTSKYITQLKDIGMVTDARWVDYDNDEDQDLIIVGDWMPITIFENRGNFFQQQFEIEGLANTEGWWKSITPYDINQDGNMDFIAGNLGTNSMFKAGTDQSVRLYVHDFDRNGSLDQVYAFKKEDEFIPYHLKAPLARQLSFIDAKFPTHEEYSDKTMSDIFTEQQLESARQLNAYQFSSVAIINNGDGTFEVQELPKEAQYAPIFNVTVDDFNADGTEELLMTGNFSGTRPKEGYYDANHGLLYQIDEEGNFSLIDYRESGLWIRGDVRDVEIITTDNGKLLVIGKNNDQTEIYRY